MADTRDIEKVLTLLSLSEGKKDLVAFALDDAEEIILNYCHIDKIPERLHQTMLRMALDLYRAEKIGDSEAVGTLSSVTVGDTSTCKISKALYPLSPNVFDSHCRIHFGQETRLPSQYCVKSGCVTFGRAM